MTNVIALARPCATQSTTVDAERSEVGELVSAVLWVAIGMLDKIEQRSFKEVAA